MNWLIPNLPRGIMLGFCLFITTLPAFSQSTCPCNTSCNPCAGGISYFRIKYNGSVAAMISALDNLNLPFNGLVQPGQVFDVAGQSNGKFSGSELYLLINAVPNASITTTCSFQFDPTVTYGMFSVVAAASKSNGILCCTANANPIAAPVITGCPSNIQVAAAGSCSATVTWTPPQATECDILSFTSNYSPGAVFPIWVTQVIYTATDDDNLSSTCKFNIKVIDGTSPTVVKPTPTVTVSAGANCRATASWTPPEFSDNCGVSTITSTHIPGATFMLGTTEVSYTAKDAAGNATKSIFQVVVKDTTVPTVDKCPSDITIVATIGCSAKVSWTPPVFADVCSTLQVTASHAPGSEFPVGLTAVTYTATDKNNNVATCKFNVFVKDRIAPVLVGCPNDVTGKTALSPGTIAIDWNNPTATDDCSEVLITSTHQSGDIFPIGTTKVIYTVSDASLNKDSCSFKVTIGWEDIELSVVQLITPDGNDVNDDWVIGNIEKYKNNKVVIVDRWGNVVYTGEKYDNEKNIWNGKRANGSVVPTGTYFYTITVYAGPHSIEKRGFIEVVR